MFHSLIFVKDMMLIR